MRGRAAAEVGEVKGEKGVAFPEGMGGEEGGHVGKEV